LAITRASALACGRRDCPSGPGYRIYFGKDGESIIILVLGGTKGSQARDIRRAQEFWRDYLKAKRHGKTK
jgi:putative component of toxin-antitoxin plasmid stabilization module